MSSEGEARVFGLPVPESVGNAFDRSKYHGTLKPVVISTFLFHSRDANQVSVSARLRGRGWANTKRLIRRSSNRWSDRQERACRQFFFDRRPGHWLNRGMVKHSDHRRQQ